MNPDHAGPAQSLGNDRQWERETIEKLVFATLNEQRSARRWKIFFRLAWLLLIAGIAFMALRQASPSAAGA